MRSGSDLLLALDGLYPRARRVALSAGARWSRGRYRCSVGRARVTCRAGGRGFTLPAAGVRTL